MFKYLWAFFLCFCICITVAWMFCWSMAATLSNLCMLLKFTFSKKCMQRESSWILSDPFTPNCLKLINFGTCIYWNAAVTFCYHFEICLLSFLFPVPTWTSSHKAASLLIESQKCSEVLRVAAVNTTISRTAISLPLNNHSFLTALDLKTKKNFVWHWKMLG